MRQANKIARRVCYLKLVSNKTAVVLICSSGSNKTTQDILLAEAWRGMGYRKSGQFASLSISLCERHLVFWHYFVIVNILCCNHLQPPFIWLDTQASLHLGPSKKLIRKYGARIVIVHLGAFGALTTKPVTWKDCAPILKKCHVQNVVHKSIINFSVVYSGTTSLENSTYNYNYSCMKQLSSNIDRIFVCSWGRFGWNCEMASKTCENCPWRTS